MKRLLFCSPLFFTASALFAQDVSPTPELSGGAVAAICAGGLVVPLISIAIWLFIAIWVMRDAKRRNSPNATLVTVLAWIPMTTVIGLIVHLVTRPKTIAGNP
ncbi:MAG TPA: hypothetical protein VLO30_09225 [Chthoniobacterales bacterium]|nr:hypothetical protein [Chthoniobacterales bacterium]